MPVIFRMARRYIARRFLQSLLFIIGVALGVAMVIAIDLANGSASRAFMLSTESITGRATHQISGGPAGVPTTVYEQLRVALGLRTAAPVVTEYVRAVELGDQPLRLLGVEPFAEPPFRDYLTNVEVLGQSLDTAQALSTFMTQPDTILLSQTLAERFGIELGDTLALRLGSARVNVQVIGLLRTSDSMSAQALDNLILSDIATAQEIIGRPGFLSYIDLLLPDDYDLAPLEALLPQGVVITSTRQSNDTLTQMTAAFELNLQALSLLALTVGVFLIYNTVTFSVVQRRPVIGTMRALGATRPQIFMLMLGEALVLGLIGTVFGLGLGILFGRGAVGLVSQTINDLYFTVNVQRVVVAPGTLIKGALIGLVASVVAAALPAYEATNTPPVGTLRRSDVEQQAQRRVPWATAAAIMLHVLGWLLLQLPTTSIVIAFAALFAFVLGGALFTPLVLLVLMHLLTPLAGALFGILGRMAPRAVVRSLSRTSIAVAALTVAVSVIVGVTVMIASFRNTVSDWLDTTLSADIYISAPAVNANRSAADIDPAILDDLALLEGVARVEWVRSVQVIAPDYPDLPPVNLNAGAGELSTGQRRFAWLADGSDGWEALAAGQVLASEPFAFHRGITPQNNRLTLLTDRGPYTVTVAGVFYDYSTEQGTVFMGDSLYRELYDDPYISDIALVLEEGTSAQAVMDVLQTQALVGTDLTAQANRDLRDSVFVVFERAFSITTALQVLATVVAFIGILSALMSLQLEHTREYGVMRATGMTAWQLWRYTLLQTGLMGITAGLLALPVGFVLALVLIYMINVRSFGWTMALDWQVQPFIQAFAVAVVAALAAGLYPAWRLGRLITARALRSE